MIEFVAMMDVDAAERGPRKRRDSRIAVMEEEPAFCAAGCLLRLEGMFGGSKLSTEMG